MEKEIKVHPWERVGLGAAPFRYVGAFDNLFRLPDGSVKPGGSCAYCAAGIRYCFNIEAADGKKFYVGSECVAKVNGVSEPIAREVAKVAKGIKSQVARDKRQASKVAAAAQRKADREAKAAEAKARAEANPFYQRLAKAVAAGEGGDFLKSIKEAFEDWGALSEKQAVAAERVLKQIEDRPAKLAASKFAGEEGARIEIEAVVEDSRIIRYGRGFGDSDCYLNKLRSVDGGLLVWFGARPLEVGEKVKGSARIKKNDEFQGERQSVIKNPRWKEAA